MNRIRTNQPATAQSDDSRKNLRSGARRNRRRWSGVPPWQGTLDAERLCSWRKKSLRCCSEERRLGGGGCSSAGRRGAPGNRTGIFPVTTGRLASCSSLLLFSFLFKNNIAHLFFFEKFLLISSISRLGLANDWAGMAP